MEMSCIFALMSEQSLTLCIYKNIISRCCLYGDVAQLVRAQHS